MSTFYGNVYFLGVARVANKGGIVMAHISYNGSETDLNGVRQVLEQPNMNMVAGKYYSFLVAQLAWHLIADDLGIIYVFISNPNYPQRSALSCLEELQRTFSAKVGEKATTAKQDALTSSCSALLQKVCVKYDNLAEVDKLAAVSRKVDAVKLVMQDNINVALQNCVKLESIEQTSEELQQQAGIFKKSANELKNKMWWKNMQMKLIIAFIVLAILGIIIGVSVAYSQQNQSSSK